MRNARSQWLVAGFFTPGIEDLETPCEGHGEAPTTARGEAKKRSNFATAMTGTSATSLRPAPFPSWYPFTLGIFGIGSSLLYPARVTQFRFSLLSLWCVSLYGP